MRKEFKQYFNENMLISPHGEDDILYTAEFATLSLGFEYSWQDALQAINSLKHNTKFYPNKDNQTWSHDMHIGLVCLSKRYKLDTHNNWLWFNAWRRIQPWNVTFYLFIMDDIRHYIGLLLLPILSFYMVFNLLVHKYDSNGILATSEPLIIWLMLNTVQMPLTKRLCDYIVKKRLGSYYEYARVYFGEKHPISILMKEKGI